MTPQPKLTAYVSPTGRSWSVPAPTQVPVDAGDPDDRQADDDARHREEKDLPHGQLSSCGSRA